VKKGIGKALEVGISPRFQPEVVPEEEVSLLYNPKRLRIIEYLANEPCASISEISASTGIPLSSIRWHLKKMIENLLLEECARSRYAPAGMVPYELTALFMALHSPVEADIVDVLIKRGSMKAREIRRGLSVSPQNLSYHLKKLVDFGIIHREKGYYSVDIDVLEVQEKASALTGEFVANLMLKGRMQGVSMEMEHGKQGYTIKVRGKEEMGMEIDEFPFHEILG